MLEKYFIHCISLAFIGALSTKPEKTLKQWNNIEKSPLIRNQKQI